MNVRMTGISLSLCACLLTTCSAWATEPSPFALPPENDQPQSHNGAACAAGTAGIAFCAADRKRGPA